jgi:hypothetical protein
MTKKIVGEIVLFCFYNSVVINKLCIRDKCENEKRLTNLIYFCNELFINVRAALSNFVAKNTIRN